MKKILLVAGLGLLSIFSLAPTLRAEGTTQKEKHLAEAKRYEALAADQEKVIQEHKDMQVDFKKKNFINEKISPMAKIKKMEKHCGMIVTDASKLKAEYEMMAKIHTALAETADAK